MALAGDGHRRAPGHGLPCGRSQPSKRAQLWVDIPAVYREQATLFTDQYGPDTGVMPAAQHQAMTKKARKTNPIERFHTMLRPRVARLGRDTLAFSKQLENHIGALRDCICHDNLTRAPALHL
jgi:insertion element IS1 protein InsB